MKILIISGVFLVAFAGYSQIITESVQPLSPEAQKGYIDDVRFEQDGKIHVIYQNKIDKKGAEITYEDYIFDKDLKFIEKKNTSVTKEIKPDKETQRLGAYVGGCTSFDILGMKLRVTTDKVKLSNWNYKKQRYDTRKVINSETVKLRSESGKAYAGIEKYWTEDGQALVVLASYETKDKANPKKYVHLTIDFDGNVKEKPLDVSGSYSLVYSQEISEEQAGKPVGKQDIIVILAPKQGSPNISEYVYLHYDISGTLKNKLTFASPSTNLLVTNATVIDGSVFLFGQSKNEKVAFEKVFEDYAPLPNPCYPDDDNYQMYKYNKAANEQMDNFHVLKISGGKLDFATTSAISGIKAKVKAPPSEKGETAYKGKKFSIAKFEVTPSNEYLIAGQLTSRVNIGSIKEPNYVTAYGDIVCLHLDANGNIKAQYAVDKIFEAKKSVTWEMPMNFYFTPDGKSVYWEIYEVKGFKDNSYWAAVNSWYGVNSYFPRYYPRVTKIDLVNLTIGDFKVLGMSKYFLYPNHAGSYIPEAGGNIYIGKNNDESSLWLGKVKFE
jgi:hypothetical protein